MKIVTDISSCAKAIMGGNDPNRFIPIRVPSHLATNTVTTPTLNRSRLISSTVTGWRLLIQN
jgi:hypothetical protein